MNYLNGNFYEDIKDNRCFIHRSENFVLQKRNPPLSLGTQYQFQNNIQIKKKQKVVENNGS